MFGNRRGNRNGGHNNHHHQPRRHHQNHNGRNNAFNGPKNRKRTSKCGLCGSWNHNANQCNATFEEKNIKQSYDNDGADRFPTCIYCNKDNSHLPVNCFKSPNGNNKSNGQRNNNGNKQHGYCNFCKRQTNHTFQDCHVLAQWRSKVDGLIINGANRLPYCVLCGADHKPAVCSSGRQDRRKQEFVDKSQLILMEWMQAPHDTDLSIRDIAFCGYCEKFGNHNTQNCDEAANDYQDNKYRFLTERFGAHFDSDSVYTSEDRGILGAKTVILLDGTRKEKCTRPLVEKKCRMCRTVLPKTIKSTDSQPDHEVIVSCVNPRCKQLNVLEVENADGTVSRRGNHNWGGLNITTREHAERFLASTDQYWYPHFAHYKVTTDSKGQPYYDGPQIMTLNASRHFGTDKYHDKGWWDFNDPGNYQLFFPPATCHFTARDKAVRDEPNCPINHTRSGLIPFCSGCGLFGTVSDEDNDVVMAQSGRDMDGNWAGSGPGYVYFENPLYRLGANNAPDQLPYLKDQMCWCSVTNGSEPEIAWVKERREPSPPTHWDLGRGKRIPR